MRQTEAVTKFVSQRVACAVGISESLDVAARGEQLDCAIASRDIVEIDPLCRHAARGQVLQPDHETVVLGQVISVLSGSLVGILL